MCNFKSLSGEEQQVVSESISIPHAVTGAAKSLFQGFTNSFKKIVFPKDDSVLGTLLNRYDPPSLKDQFLNKYDTEPTKSVRLVKSVALNIIKLSEFVFLGTIFNIIILIIYNYFPDTFLRANHLIHITVPSGPSCHLNFQAYRHTFP